VGFTDPKLGGLLLLLLFGLGSLLLLLLFVGGLLFWAKAGAAITANITAISAATATTVMMRFIRILLLSGKSVAPLAQFVSLGTQIKDEGLSLYHYYFSPLLAYAWLEAVYVP